MNVLLPKVWGIQDNLSPVYIDLGKTDLTSDKIKLYVRKNLTAAFCDMVGQFPKERLIRVLF